MGGAGKECVRKGERWKAEKEGKCRKGKNEGKEIERRAGRRGRTKERRKRRGKERGGKEGNAPGRKEMTGGEG